MITDTEAEKALDYIRDNATKAAQARANRIYVEEYRKTIKAQLMKESMKESADLPLGAQEREAYSDVKYVQHLNAIREAVEQDEYFRWMLTAAEAKLKCWQTQSANNRKGMV